MASRQSIDYVTADSYPLNLTEVKRVDRAAGYLGLRWQGEGSPPSSITRDYKVVRVQVDRYDDGYLDTRLLVQVDGDDDDLMDVEMNTAADATAFERQVKTDQQEAAAMIAEYEELYPRRRR